MRLMMLSFLIAFGIQVSALGKSPARTNVDQSRIIVVKGYAYGNDELTFSVEEKQWYSIEDFSNESVYRVVSVSSDGSELESRGFNPTFVSEAGRKFSIYLNNLPGIAKVRLLKGSQLIGEQDALAQ